jgi:hypothetical protein
LRSHWLNASARFHRQRCSRCRSRRRAHVRPAGQRARCLLGTQHARAARNRKHGQRRGFARADWEQTVDRQLGCRHSHKHAHLKSFLICSLSPSLPLSPSPFLPLPLRALLLVSFLSPFCSLALFLSHSLTVSSLSISLPPSISPSLSLSRPIAL